MQRAQWQTMIDEWEREEVDPIETPEAAYRQSLQHDDPQRFGRFRRIDEEAA